MGTHPIFESDFDCLTDIKMAAEAAQNRVEDAIMIDSSDDEADESSEYSPKNLLKCELNLLFSLRRLKTTKNLEKDFCFTAAASCIRAANPFMRFIEEKERQLQREKNALATFDDLPYEIRCKEMAKLTAEDHFYKICEQIYREDEKLYCKSSFQWFVESFNLLPGSQKLYESLEKKYIEEIAPHVAIDKLPNPLAKQLQQGPITVKEEPQTETNS